MTKRGTSRKKNEEGVSPASSKTKRKHARRRVSQKKKTTNLIPASRLQTVIDPETGVVDILQSYDDSPGTYRYIAKMMYISGKAGPTEVSRKLGIPMGTVRSWCTRDKWVMLRRQVNRQANKDAVRTARRSMSNYVLDIDRGLNLILGRMAERLESIPDDKLVDSESQALKYLIEVWRLKIQLVRTLTYGTQGKAFTPHPTNLIFDDTADPTMEQLLPNADVEDMLKAIPEYMQSAAKMVMGIGPEDIDEDILEAVQMRLDEIEASGTRAKKRRKRAKLEKKIPDLPEEFAEVEDMLDMEEEE